MSVLFLVLGISLNAHADPFFEEAGSGTSTRYELLQAAYDAAPDAIEVSFFPALVDSAEELGKGSVQCREVLEKNPNALYTMYIQRYTSGDGPIFGFPEKLVRSPYLHSEEFDENERAGVLLQWHEKTLEVSYVGEKNPYTSEIFIRKTAEGHAVYMGTGYDKARIAGYCWAK